LVGNEIVAAEENNYLDGLRLSSIYSGPSRVDRGVYFQSYWTLDEFEFQYDSDGLLIKSVLFFEGEQTGSVEYKYDCKKVGENLRYYRYENAGLTE